jgi:hypothetical protein
MSVGVRVGAARSANVSSGQAGGSAGGEFEDPPLVFADQQFDLRLADLERCQDPGP